MRIQVLLDGENSSTAQQASGVTLLAPEFRRGPEDTKLRIQPGLILTVALATGNSTTSVAPLFLLRCAKSEYFMHFNDGLSDCASQASSVLSLKYVYKIEQLNRGFGQRF